MEDFNNNLLKIVEDGRMWALILFMCSQYHNGWVIYKKREYGVHSV